MSPPKSEHLPTPMLDFGKKITISICSKSARFTHYAYSKALTPETHRSSLPTANPATPAATLQHMVAVYTTGKTFKRTMKLYSLSISPTCPYHNLEVCYAKLFDIVC